MIERSYSVWLSDTRVGSIDQRGDHTRFRFVPEYLADPDRPVLGLVFEDDLGRMHSNALRLPPWFSNLLPEGQLREWIARDRGVSADREIELLSQVGGDLPGAVRVLPGDAAAPMDWHASTPEQLPTIDSDDISWRFSLAGVGMKFSMLQSGERLTMPASGEGGNWIVKLPDVNFADVPRNEFAMMSLASRVGIDVPEIMLVSRDTLTSLPENAWRSSEDVAYAVRRFDRNKGRRVHIEDFAQVMNVYPYGDRKYEGNYETIANIIYRGWDEKSLIDYIRRLAFNFVIGNGDAHLKNWSLIYRNPKIPRLSPAYDLVSTRHYFKDEKGGYLALKLGGHKRPEKVSMYRFTRIAQRLNVAESILEEVVTGTVEKIAAEWPNIAHLVDTNAELQADIDDCIRVRSEILLRQ